ncbi:LacI family DNA-binding transcriptional regulator [Streptosporangium roseum]|uniref:LacI family transcription regulator n=1 Tax=Streptosporangium roseum (strain ATCC 12428 / DSM 43021 / JCM 3005 / KCTC 9067 / NCIMB 10171 / NRRL 2505 / NI 9100) TaxID=479432 RepID=D2AUC1_STRRD|nr:LacI family DNA-binding transcriptional regulator [Streptosporangium roseum]ACZ90576.1 LacI family transcription regulator [Streptosporangium roseum DSM 43021]
MPQPRKRATIREVAKATGLSPASVSYALRGMQVSEETIERVRRVAAELGYEADPIARALASGRTGMIGLLCGSLEDLWQQALAVGIGRALKDNDRYALILDATGDPSRERTLARQLRDQRVDALIVQPVDPAAPLWAELCESLPVVSIGDSLAGASTAGEVVFDNRAGVTLALEHMRDRGHRRVAVLTPTRASTPDRPADVHVLAEAGRLGLDIEVVTAPQALVAATDVARRMLAGGHRAFFCFADSIAYGVYAASAEQGLRIPFDVSVMGYDDHPMSGLLSPGLTTVDWDIDGIVRAAVRLVVAAADGNTRRRRIVQAPELRERGSVG